MKNQPKINDNYDTQFEDKNEEFPGLEQPNLYHFNINNETEEQAVTRLDAQIRVSMRQYTITAIRDRGLELPDVTYMMKLYLKLVGQELRARDLAIKERQLALKERAMALKESKKPDKSGDSSNEMAPEESVSPNKATSETPPPQAQKEPPTKAAADHPQPPPSKNTTPPTKTGKKPSGQTPPPNAEPYSEIVSPVGTGISVDAIGCSNY